MHVFTNRPLLTHMVMQIQDLMIIRQQGVSYMIPGTESHTCMYKPLGIWAVVQLPITAPKGTVTDPEYTKGDDIPQLPNTDYRNRDTLTARHSRHRQGLEPPYFWEPTKTVCLAMYRCVCSVHMCNIKAKGESAFYRGVFYCLPLFSPKVAFYLTSTCRSMWACVAIVLG